MRKDVADMPAPATAGAGELSAGIQSASDWTVFARLTLMMLLEFFVWGSWFATLGLVLATHGLPTIIGTAFSLAAVAAIVSPMFLGALVDRFIPSQNGLGIAHLIGGVLLCFVPAAITSGNGTLVLALIFVYMLFFQPTLGLSNSIAFRHLGSNQRWFPYIRVFGTLGWVIAGQAVGWAGLDDAPELFYLTATFSILFGVYAFTLPSTPAPAKGVRFSPGDVIGAKALPLLRNRNFAVLMGCALLTAVSLGVYNTYASTFLGALGFQNVAGLLSIGQASEVVFIVTIPFVLQRIGMKWALLAGMFMWAVRLALFLAVIGAHPDGHTWIAVAAIALQGICNDFFLVLAAMYIGNVTSAEVSAQAQSMLILVVSGLGAFVGAEIAGRIYDHSVATGAAGDLSGWNPIWALGIGSALVAAVIWATLFRRPRDGEPTLITTAG
ncbi:MFS transporter [Kineosporia sp. J2-2]|uniref:MFS transporter n=1 Tax=Kineosporia corallincola TaxID=2835133 RepID=A0ABS5TGP9_9ACTN|nr:MFS transporter [Kineosporia corallincola]MBT0770256.1 MFS transporter [Kineosporia corallincola]